MEQEQPTSNWSDRIARAAAWVIPIASMLMLPGIALFYHRWNVHFFSAGSVVLLALGFLLLVPDRLTRVFRGMSPVLQGAFGVLTLISLWHIFRHSGTYRLADIGFTLLYVVMPLYGLVFRQELCRSLPWLFSGFWCLNVIACMIQRFVYKQLFFGIPSNINWNAALTFLTGAVFLWFILTGIRRKQIRIAAALVVAGISLWILAETLCRALIPGILLAVLVYVALRIPAGKWKRVFRYGVLFCILLGVLAAVKVITHPGMKEKLLQDERVFLSLAVPDLIKTAPVLGVGTPSFEQEFLPFFRGEKVYYDLRHISDRIDHPHNDILFTIAGYGIVGFLCIYLIFGSALFSFYRKYEEEECLPRLLGFLFIVLLCHAQFDLVFFHIPTATLALMLPGMMLAPSLRENTAALPRNACLAVRSSGGLVFAVAVFAALMELYSSHMIWLGQGELMRYGAGAPSAWKYYHRAYNTPQASPFTLFTVLSDYLWTDQTRAVDFLKVVEKLDRTPIPDYAHVNCTRARALEYLGRMEEAEKYYLREAELYPFHVIPYLNLLEFYRKTNRRPQYQYVEKCLIEVMQKRNLDFRDLQIIVNNPQYDVRPWDIPAHLRTPKQP